MQKDIKDESLVASGCYRVCRKTRHHGELCSRIQLCFGQTSSSEAAVHVICVPFGKEETEDVLLVYVAKTFNNINRQTFFHNICILYPNFAKYANNFKEYHRYYSLSVALNLNHVKGQFKGSARNFMQSV